MSIHFCLAIDTAAIRMLTGTGDHSRKPDILADAAYVILSKYVSDYILV